MSTRWTRTGNKGDSYDRGWEGMANPHGEADFVSAYEPSRVLDAGCGTGRVAIELAARGVEVVGVDVDEAMLDSARRKAPDLTWVQADLVDVDLTSPPFDVVVMAGNVMIFVAVGTEGRVVRRLADHLDDAGLLIAGFQLRPGGYGVEEYDEHCAAAGLRLVERFSSWDREPFQGGDYAVSVHRRFA